MTLYNFLDSLTNGRYDGLFSRIYGNSDKELLKQRAKFLNLAEKFSSLFPEHEDIHVYSVPVSEVICGRNAEKYNGCSLSLTLSTDICAIVGFRKDNKFSVCIDGVDMREVTDLKLSEHSGFDAYISADLPTDHTFHEVVKMLCDAIEKKQTGGCVFTDFKDEKNPQIRTIDCTPLSGYSLCIVDTGADVKEENYEIDNFLKALGVRLLREADEDTFIVNKTLREKCSDSEILTAIRLYNELECAKQECEALEYDRAADFFNLVNNSQSSVNDSVIIGVMVCERYLNGSGAVRADGRKIQAFVPTYKVEDFSRKIEDLYGVGSCRTAGIRSEGAVEII